MISNGVLREDFYFRISQNLIRTTPLSERIDDIEFIASNILGESSLPLEILDDLDDRPWRGNVRELLSYIRSEEFHRRLQSEATTKVDLQDRHPIHIRKGPKNVPTATQDKPEHKVSSEAATDSRPTVQDNVYMAFDHIIKSDDLSSERNLFKVIQGYLYSYSLQRFGSMERARERTFIAPTTIHAWKKYVKNE
jgi:DNA-binding NtrC family response regulator